MIVWWFVIFLVLLVIEMLTINLITLWFAFGAVSALLVSIFTDSIIIQLVAFILVSVISLIIIRPVINRFMVEEITPTNLDRVIGKNGVVIKEINLSKNGQVKVLDKVWTAASNKHFNVGDKIKVVKIEGVKLIVEEDE